MRIFGKMAGENPSSRRITEVTSSALLGQNWLFFVGLLLVISVVGRMTPLLLITAVFFLTGIISRLWERFCLVRVEYKHHLNVNHVFFGEEAVLEIEVTNRKVLPLPWILIRDQIPAGLELVKDSADPSPDSRRRELTNVFSLGWYQRVRRSYHFRCRQRGYYSFGPSTLRSGDLFGVFSREITVYGNDHLLVYPKLLPLESLGIPSRQPIGDIRTRRRIFQDPSLTIGVRDYQSGDNLKHIHWKATARMQQLQTKIYDATTTVDFSLFLDVRTLRKNLFGSAPELLELAIVSAASIAKHAVESGDRVGLYSNSRIRFPDGLVRLPPSRDKEQLLRILEALSQINQFEAMPLTSVIMNESQNLSWGSTVTVVSAAPTDDLISALYTLAKAGRRVVLIKVGDNIQAIHNMGFAVYHVSSDVNWRDLSAISLRN